MTEKKHRESSMVEEGPVATYSNCQDGPVSYVRFNFSHLCRFTVSLPLIGLVVCFVSANIFQQNDIHETHCRVSTLQRYAARYFFFNRADFSSVQVYNVIPSISSITGISPQRYIWRVCIAVHVGPRFLTSLVYHHFYLTLVSKVETSKRKYYIFHVWLALVLNLVEQAALIGVTYVSNRENYREFRWENVECLSDSFDNLYIFFAAIHEKIFITFMISSQVHMLIVLRLLKMANFGRDGAQQRSFLLKNWLFYLSLFCTFGLCIFFVKHRVYCHDLGTNRNKSSTLLDRSHECWFFSYLTLQLSVGSHSSSTGLLRPTWASMVPLFGTSLTNTSLLVVI